MQAFADFGCYVPDMMFCCRVQLPQDETSLPQLQPAKEPAHPTRY
jgi:hypothetical protein